MSDKTINAQIAKRDSKQQLVLCEVFVPDEIDSQGEFASPATLEKAAHSFNANGHQKNVTIQHDGVNINAAVVESYIAKQGDPLFTPGTWVAVIKVRDPAIWQAIERGTLKGVSFEGTGNRREATLKGVQAVEMIDLDITTISLVDRPANKRPFTMTKSETAVTEALTSIAKSIETIGKAQDALLQRIEAQNEVLSSIGTDKSGRVVKTQPERAGNPNAAEIDSELRLHARLEDRLWRCMERPDQYPAGTETDLRARIEKSADRLYALGYEPKRATLDSGSAFFARGGVSTFLQASPSTVDEIILGRQSGIQKNAEDDIEVENCLTFGGTYGGDR